MKAWIGSTDSGGLHFVQGNVPKPRLGTQALLVRVRAIGINRVDQRPKTSHFSHTEPAPAAIPGLEMAGEVVEVGSDVVDFRLGETVMAMVQGAAAEFVGVHQSLAMRVPSGLSLEVAGAIPISYLTAYDALVLRGTLRGGEHLLIHAVTSGVGIASVQLGAVLGAATIGGSSTAASKLDAVAGIGMTYGLLDPYAGFASSVLDATSGHGADVVVDNIGGSILNETLAASALGGRIVDVGRLGGTKAEIDLDLLALRRASLIGVTFRTRSLAEHAEICASFMSDHVKDVEAGRLKPVISEVFGFDRLPDAIAFARASKSLGKAVVKL